MLVAIVGGGQLGRMLALAGYPLGMRFRVLDPSPDAPAGQLAELVLGAYDDLEALRRLAAGADVVTYEFENVPADAARRLEDLAPVFPSPRSLEVAQDRLKEKELFTEVGLAVPPFAAVDSEEDLRRALEVTGLPAIVKTRRLGYDGKGQALIRQPDDVPRAWAALGGVPSVAEAFVDFHRELSIVAVRGLDGAMAFYPLIENVHLDGILRMSRAPASVGAELQLEAQHRATRVLEHLGHVGVLAIELFETGGGLLANEMAPRVHNSGHWTIEGAETSQFENHLRAVTGLPLGPTTPTGHTAMVNLIGAVPNPAAVAAIPGAHLHLYGKEPRPGRKLGHVTVRAPARGGILELILKVEALTSDPW
jgi:5-(carboxyamino)imidazole ribonucleotide synthase